MPVRGPRGGRWVGRVAFTLIVASLALVLAGCWKYPEPEGAWHQMRPGETIWRVAKNYGTSVKRIVHSNRIRDVREVQAGRRLWIPGGTAPRPCEPKAVSEIIRLADVESRPEEGALWHGRLATF